MSIASCGGNKAANWGGINCQWIIQEARNGATEPKQIAAAAIKALGIPDRR
jgi:hypothetical protein